jgi:hypothetical protein
MEVTMKNIILLLFAISILILSGCSQSKLLFKEDFDSYYGSVETYPSGPPNDIIKIVGTPQLQSPTVDGNHRLTFTSPDGYASLISDNFNDPDTTKTIYWKGNYALGDGPMWFIVSAGNSSGDIYTAPHLKLHVWRNQAKLQEWNSSLSQFNPLQGPDSCCQDVHYIFISLRPDSKSYYISMSSTSSAEKVWTGSLKQEFVNQLKNNPRILVHVKFPSIATPATYYMDNIIMREMK